MPWTTPVAASGTCCGDLQRLAAEIEQRHQQGGEEDADRVEPAEEGDDDGGEAVAGGDAGQELADGARDLADAGKAREAAGRRRQNQTAPDSENPA
jgi:hypothetical protein